MKLNNACKFLQDPPTRKAYDDTLKMYNLNDGDEPGLVDVPHNRDQPGITDVRNQPVANITEVTDDNQNL